MKTKSKNKIQNLKMTSYNTILKEKSPMKATMNNFLGNFANPQTKAIVLDAETMLSSSTLVRYGVDPLNIVVINNDTNIIDTAHRNGHTKSIAGISSAVLPQLRGTFDIIYLDYCGFPDIRSDGFNPAFDILWSGDRLNKDGIMVVTFSRRATNCVEKAEAMIPVSLELVKTICYSETCAMFAMILTKGNDQRFIRDTFNEIKLSHHKKRKMEEVTEESQPKKKKKKTEKKTKKKSTVPEKHTTIARENRLKDNLPSRYSLIAYYYDGHLSPGIVEIVKDRLMRVLWVDTESPYDYGANKDYYPIGNHVDISDPTHSKDNFGWTYLYDIFETGNQEDIDEMKRLPISMKRKDFLEVKKKVEDNRLAENYVHLVTYFGIELLV